MNAFIRTVKEPHVRDHTERSKGETDSNYEPIQAAI